MTEIFSLVPKRIAPCIVLGTVFGVAGHYFETKPQVVILGLFALFAVFFLTSGDDDQILKADNQNLKSENDSLKKNLMQVYAMVQQQKSQNINAGPPPPIPPSMTGVPNTNGEEENGDEAAKPYL